MSVDGSKADTMLFRFVTNALDSTERLTPEHAQDAVHAAADSLGVSHKVLDHTICRFQSNLATPRWK